MSLSDQINSAITTYLSQNPAVPGLILSAQYNGATIFCQGYGVINENGTTPTTATTFQIDSLSKALTAFAVLRLYEQGAIKNITDTIGTYMTALPDCTGCNWNDSWNTIQIDQLLAMVSGIPDASSTKLTYLEILSNVAKQQVTPPGVSYVYSDPNFFLVGALINTILGNTAANNFATYIQEQVFSVFGMINTGLTEQASAQDPALPYFNNAYTNWRNPNCGYSSGGFASTMADLEAFAIGMANGLVLQPSSYQLMWTNYILTDGKQGPFGLGWDVTTNTDGAVTMVVKDGGGWGWSSSLAYSPAMTASSILPASASVLMNGTTAKAGSANQLTKQVISLIRNDQ